MTGGFVIAIDGPVASGKGTVAKLLAQKIGAVQIDTGSMYRALALKCIREKIDFSDKAQVTSLLFETKITLESRDDNDLSSVVLDGEVVNDFIRSPTIAQGASIVSKFPEVREYLVKKQKELIGKLRQDARTIVIEGRIVATEVVPDAEYKLFLTATIDTRAKRRLEQHQQKGHELFFDEVLKETVERDARDKNYLPDHPEDLGYRVLDTSDLKEEQTIEIIVQDLQKRGVVHDTY